jgi:hypothetical protein
VGGADTVGSGSVGGADTVGGGPVGNADAVGDGSVGSADAVGGDAAGDVVAERPLSGGGGAGALSRLTQGESAVSIRCTTPPRAGRGNGATVSSSGGPAGPVAAGAAGSTSRWITPAGASAETMWPSGARNEGLRQDTSESPKSCCADTGRSGPKLR